MAYILIICIGVSWGGCGASTRGIFPDEESCFRALREAKHDARSVAVCQPASKQDLGQ